jgi:hypothetical protein
MSSTYFKTDNRYINQYILTKETTDKLGKFIVRPVGEYILYSHPTLEISAKTDDRFQLILIGYCFDYRNPGHTTLEVVNSLDITKPLSELIGQLRHLSGVYTVIWRKDDDVFIIPDMCAFREIYYGNGIISSSPTLINAVNPLQKVNDSRFHGFYGSKLFQSRLVWVGDETSFQDIKRLKPNHYLNLESGLITRFFPLLRKPSLSVDAAAKKASEIIKGILKAATGRGPVMMGLTAGWDSRLLLAASRYVRKDILYFVLSHKNADADLAISKKIASSLDLNYMQQQYSKHVNEEDFDFVSESLPNVNLNYPGLLNTSKFFSPMLSISGSASEIARVEFGIIENLTGAKLAQLAKYGGHPYPEETYNQWLNLHDNYFTHLGHSTLDFFYWEEILGNRSAKTISEAGAVGRNVFPAFNCIELIETLLSVDPSNRQKQNNRLYLSMIKELWPDVLKYPINPGFRKKAIQYMQVLGVYNVYRTLFPAGIEKSLRS